MHGSQLSLSVSRLSDSIVNALESQRRFDNQIPTAERAYYRRLRYNVRLCDDWAMQQRAKATREAVLNAAAKVFALRGYTSATIAEILAESGVTKGAAYFHFDSKEDLARAIVNEQLSWMAKQPEAQELGLQASVDLSYKFAEALQSNPVVRASIRLTLERNTFEDRPGEQNPYCGWITQVSNSLEPDVSSGVLRIPAPDAAYLIVSMLTGTQLVAEALTRRADLIERVHFLWVSILPALVSSSDSGIDIRPPRSRK